MGRSAGDVRGAPGYLGFRYRGIFLRGLAPRTHMRRNCTQAMSTIIFYISGMLICAFAQLSPSCPLYQFNLYMFCTLSCCPAYAHLFFYYCPASAQLLTPAGDSQGDTQSSD